MHEKKKFFKLEYYRKKYGITRVQMASLIGLSVSSYAFKVNRKVPFTFDEVVIIAKAINDKAIKSCDKALTLDEIFLD